MMETIVDDEFLTLKRALQAFQSARLNRTYADLKQNPQYSKIGRFFFEKIYAPEDFTFRDTSIKKLHRLLNGKVYKGMLSAVNQVIELHELTDEIDDRMVAQMMAMGVGPDLTMAQYQAVYRSLDNYEQRLYQIDLGRQVTRRFYALSKKWIVKVSLKTVRNAAHLIGMGKILDFIHEGYDGFRAIDDIEYFETVIDTRERAWHDQLWKGSRIEG